jgi:putative acyl-CoA dehydrogenase
MAFQKRLVDQALMRNVLADLAIEVEAATVLVMRIAGAFDRASTDAAEQNFGRLATAIAKYWMGKQAPRVIVEALECLGGNGYVEESILPRLYREAPVNSVWEGSGNVICLDVLRAIERSPESLEAFVQEIETSRGGNRLLDARLDRLANRLPGWRRDEGQARVLVEQLALALTGALLVRHAPSAIVDAYCASHFADDGGRQFGTLPSGLDLAAIITRAQPMPS